ncbi:hypothetical protein PRIPAC_74744 [Pristionchus pacificus]|uniref:Uncharacterized protein n=1 Tax=Pristionchus pacificus TaxID=54126 RepID=A0A2A6C5P0_PRIPA|nr:hypothetical protein PRIPAC_74744 [Pristionchus pacificus]|eukprot:PDM73408.1 hypothetical protein PRIPAC_40764 [Pristionchus pacificus]
MVAPFILLLCFFLAMESTHMRVMEIRQKGVNISEDVNLAENAVEILEDMIETNTNPEVRNYLHRCEHEKSETIINRKRKHAPKENSEIVEEREEWSEEESEEESSVDEEEYSEEEDSVRYSEESQETASTSKEDNV